MNNNVPLEDIKIILSQNYEKQVTIVRYSKNSIYEINSYLRRQSIIQFSSHHHTTFFVQKYAAIDQENILDSRCIG